MSCQRALALPATRAHHRLAYNLSFTRTPRCCSAELPSNQSAPGLSRCTGLFHPTRWSLHLPSSSSVRFLLARFPSSLAVSLNSSPALQPGSSFPRFGITHGAVEGAALSSPWSLIRVYVHCPVQTLFKLKITAGTRQHAVTYKETTASSIHLLQETARKY